MKENSKMSGEGQLREQAKKQWERIDAEGCKNINDLLVADKERTVWPENTEPKFTGKKGTKLIKVAFDTKIKKYTHALKGKEVPVEEPIRLDIPDSYIYFSFHPTKKRIRHDKCTQQVGVRCQIHCNSTLLPLDSRKKHYSELVTFIHNSNHTHSQKQRTKSHQGHTFRRSNTEENCQVRMLH